MSKKYRGLMQFSKLFSFITVALLVSVIFVGLVSIPTSAAQTDTMQFRYNAQHTSDYSPVAGVTSPNGQLKWSYATENFVDATPSVANGVVYIGGGDDNVYALNATTGAKLWSYATGNGVDSGAAIVNGVVYIGSNNHKVYALDAATGTERWSYETGDYVVSSPAVVDGVVYVGSYDRYVYALDAATGTELWSFATGGWVVSSPAVADGVVYVGSYDHKVYALDAATGTELWSYTTGDNVASSPAVVDGVVYVGSADWNVYALDAATGTVLWTYATGDMVFTSPAVANGVVYVGSYDQKVYALNAWTGAKLWSYATLNQLWSSPSYANGVVYIGGQDGQIYALSAATGKKLWSYTMQMATDSSPAIANGVVYIGGQDGNVYAIGSALTQPTQLSLSVTESNPTVGQSTSFSGTLSTAGTSPTPIAHANVSLQYSIDEINWFPASSSLTTTDANGDYVFTGAFPHAGTYYYRAYYGGTAQKSAAYSPVVTITVAFSEQSAKLSLTINPPSPTVGQSVSFSGILLTADASSTPIANAQIFLQYAPDFVNFATAGNGPVTTDDNGAYVFTGTFLHAGSWAYRTYYSGSAQQGAAYSPAVTIIVTSSGQSATHTSLAASTSIPSVNQQVTFTATLKSGNTLLSGKSVTIYHYLGSTRYDDTTATSNANGQVTFTQTFSSTGPRTYYATFAGDGTYMSSTSSVITINVGGGSQTTTTLTASNSTPVVGQTVTFTVNLKSGSAGLSKPVTIWHSWPGGARVEDGTYATTNGVYKFTQSFGSTGQRIYHAEFAGDNTYASSSGTSTVNVGTAPTTATTTTITASNPNPTVGSGITLTVTVKAGSTVLLNKQVTVTHTYPGSTTPGNDGVFNTGSTGTTTFSATYGSAGPRVYTAAFAGDSQYAASTGTVTVNVGTAPTTATTTTITASNPNPAVGSAVTLTVTVKAGSTVLLNKNVTVTHTYPGSTTPGNDGVFNTGSTGTKTFSSGTYSTAGPRVYTAAFAGDSTYGASSGTVTVNVGTTTTITP